MKEHPITPPSEDHVLKWSDEWFEAKVKHMTREKHLCMQAARWGADQEREACCELLDINGCPGKWIDMLRAARRPKPLSLKEQALELVDRIEKAESVWAMSELNTIRRALEALPD